MERKQYGRLHSWNHREEIIMKRQLLRRKVTMSQVRASKEVFNENNQRKAIAEDLQRTKINRAKEQHENNKGNSITQLQRHPLR